MPCAVIRSQVPESTDRRWVCCIGQGCGSRRQNTNTNAIDWLAPLALGRRALRKRRGEIDSPEPGATKK